MNSDYACSQAGAWSVVRTHRQKESVALRGLEAQGYRTFCAMTWKTVRRARRLHHRKVPLFPGYIFLVFDDDTRQLRPINNTRGVQYLLADEAGRPARLPDGWVETLAGHTDQDGIFSYRAAFSKGDIVRIRSGAFTDLLGQIEEMDEHGRTQILLDIMSRKVRVHVPSENLQTAD